LLKIHFCEKLNQLNQQKKKKQIELIVVVGGDGTLLHAIKSYMNLGVPFFGINTGTVGFLMNDLDNNLDHEFENSKFDILKKIQICEEVKLNPLNVEIMDAEGNFHHKSAANEASICRASGQSAKFNVYINDKLQLSNVIADGAIVSTPAGSSAYNFSAGGVVLPLSSNAICLTPICAFRPRNLPPIVLPSDSIVRLEVIDLEKRPVNAFIDFTQIENISEVVVKNDKNKEIKLLLNYDFENKSIREQLRFYEKSNAQQ
jgi:NAD+ kinase